MASAAGIMPVGSPMGEIREDEVKTTEGNVDAPVFSEDATAELVWKDYERARNYVESENTAWLLEWQETDILYQSPVPYRFDRTQAGRPVRVPRFLVAKFSRTLARALKRALFGERVPFFLRPGARSTQQRVDAWTYLLTVLLRRAKFRYHGGLQINTQVLQGTGLGKYGWEERKTTKKIRRRKKPAQRIDLPSGTVEIPTTESDGFAEKEVTVTESYPWFEYRKLGTTLFDPRWCTPDQPEESAQYCVDIDFPNFEDLQEMRQMSCYQQTKDDSGKIISPGIPDEETLKKYFFQTQGQSAEPGTQTEQNMSSTGSMVTHAADRSRQTSESPLEKRLLLIERTDKRTVKSILCYGGRKLTIRNGKHDYEGSLWHPTCTWWPIDNAGYGMGIGRINGPDQRINQAVINEALKMIGYPMNSPILYRSGSENAPTQNTIWRHGGFQAVDVQPGEDVRKGMAFMEMPAVPADAWKMVDLSQRGGEELSGADAMMQQGVLTGRQGATRSATGAARVANASDQNIADPVDSFADGVIIPFIKFLIHMVKTKMPIVEIRRILSDKFSKEIIAAIDMEQFLEEDFEVEVLAGQRLAAKQGIQQLIPFFLQIVQQPQLLQFLHEKGETVDFEVIMDLLLQVSELSQQPDIFRQLTPRERVMVKQMNAGVQRIQGALALENAKGKNKVAEINRKGQVDLANNMAERAVEHISEGLPLTRAAGLLERTDDEHALANGLPDFEME